MGAVKELRQQPFIDLKHKDPDAAMKLLRGVSIFAQFTDAELRELATVGEVQSLTPKSYAVIEGEATFGLYIILDGVLAVYKTTGTSMTRIATLESGSHFGELSLFDRSVRSATVAADSPTTLFYLAAESFNAFLLRKGSDLQLRFFRTCAVELASRLRSLNADYVASQQLLWRYALRKPGKI